MEELTKQQEELINNLEVYAQLEVEKETKALQDLIDLVSASVDIRLVNGSVIQSSFRCIWGPPKRYLRIGSNRRYYYAGPKTICIP